jgi:hypothetical protein
MERCSEILYAKVQKVNQAPEWHEVPVVPSPTTQKVILSPLIQLPNQRRGLTVIDQ